MRALGFDVKKQEVLAIMRDFDRDGAGQIEYPDFLEIMTTKISERDPVEEILNAFKLFDEDSTGRISLRNLRRVARELGENLNDDELQAMIERFLADTLKRLEAAQSRLFSVIIGDQARDDS